MIRTHLLLLLLASTPLLGAEASIDTHTFGEIEPRELGPAVTGGRVMAIDGADTRTFYVGAASGGVWRTTNAGTTFEAVFEDHVPSIGAIAVSRDDPETVWVGTGEGCTRNSVSVGRGIFRSTDGGDRWESMGLEETERIPSIQLDPSDPNRLFVAALGHLWDPNPERGVYRTTDGGASWEQVLFVDADTGCADLVMDPTDPDTLYAAMWQFRRRPWTFESGGPGSGIYKTTDGGDTWHELREGLPEGDLGRIGLAVALTEPGNVYAVVESEKNAFYRSTDGGLSWSAGDSSFNVGVRPFYFSHLIADPDDPARVYKLGMFLSVTDDGGESFTTPFVEGGYIHPDLHALWIDPTDSRHLVVGTDGGIYTSWDRGSTWIGLANLPIAQFYHVGYDMARPYHVFGGLQDNGSWRAPSRSPGGIEGRDWENVGMGDGFEALADPRDPNILYVEYQGGNVLRYHLDRGETKEIKPFAEPHEPKLRFNWNTPIHLGREALYVGSQYLHRSTDRGESWRRISGDLTTDDPEKQRQEESGGLTIDNSTAENHCTIVTIAESPSDDRVIWVGTDDGNLQLTTNGGRRWTNVTDRVPDLPDHTWVSSVEPSHHSRATAYVTFDGHRTGDQTPYLYRTTDLGRTWTPLIEDDSVEGFVHVVREDLLEPNLLFLGTEAGLFASIDGGGGWAQVRGKLPRVPVRDLAIHPREGDLILATHGRGIWILDDLTPLRSLDGTVLDSDVAFLPARPPLLSQPSYIQDFPGDAAFVGRNPSEVATITYYLRKRHLFGDLRVEIRNDAGELVKTLPGGRRKGINRVRWHMRRKPPKVAPAPLMAGQAMFGPALPLGRYRVTLVKGDQQYETEIELSEDPHSPHSPEDRAVQRQTTATLYDMQEELAFLAKRATAVRDEARARSDEAVLPAELTSRLDGLARELDTIHATLVATKPGLLTGEEQLRERVVELYGAVINYGGRPTDSQLKRLEGLQTEMKEAKGAVEGALELLPELNSGLEGAGLSPIEVPTREEFDAETDGAAPRSLLLHPADWLDFLP